MRFKYCPECGEKLGVLVCGDEGEVPYCEKCKRPWFDMFSSAAIVLVVNPEGKVALLNQNYISTVYKNLVSGYIKPGESAEECAMREVCEEIGIHMRRVDLKFTKWFEKAQVLMVGFIGYTDETEMKLSVEVDAAGWFSPEDALGLVHPPETGSVSGLLVKTYLESLRSDRTEPAP
ncbi:MAG: NUDIX domain-containing protein [Clostridia bacterium]|nr:NUDIX domain-containing protein [Clostridia bacterium]